MLIYTLLVLKFTRISSTARNTIRAKSFVVQYETLIVGIAKQLITTLNITACHKRWVRDGGVGWGCGMGVEKQGELNQVISLIFYVVKVHLLYSFMFTTNLKFLVQTRDLLDTSYFYSRKKTSILTLFIVLLVLISPLHHSPAWADLNIVVIKVRLQTQSYYFITNIVNKPILF